MRLRPERGCFPISANRDLLSALVIKDILVTDFQGVCNGVFVSSRNRELRVSSFSNTESRSTA